MSKILAVLFIISFVFVSGCAVQPPAPKPQLINSFKVNYYGHYVSSSGDRILSVIYTVKDGQIVDCNGTYSYPASQERFGQTDSEPCNITKLVSKGYNAPVELITSILSNDSRNGSYKYGPEDYYWSITDVK